MRRLLLVGVLGLIISSSYSLGTHLHERGSTDVASAQSPTPFHPLSLFESPAEAQGAPLGDFRGFQKTFVTQSAVGTTISGGQMRGIVVSHTAELIVTGAPATCTYRLQGTRDGVTWFNISAADLVCTTSTVGFETGKPAVSVRGNLLTLTGGTAPTVTLKYIGR